MSNTLLKNALLATTMFASATFFASPAFAQGDAADDGEEAIVVTGSRIARPNLEQSSPVSVIGESEIQLQQATSAEELLREIPGQLPGLNQNVNNGGNGSANINLRGLGTNRNLILLDGRRIVPADLVARVDLNVIPLALIERVDVFTGGASTVYGADAVSGVVNFITRRDFAGIDLTGGMGITERGDGATGQASIAVGANFDDGRGNVVMAMSYTNVAEIRYGDRDASRIATSSGTGQFAGSTTSVPVTLRNGPIGQLNLATGAFEAATPAGTFNTNPLNLLQTPLTRFNIFAQGRYEISDAIEVYAQGWFNRNRVLFNAAPTGIFANSVGVPLSNPFLPAAARNQFCATLDFDAVTPGNQFLTPAQCAAAATALTPADPNYRVANLTAERRFAEDGPRQTRYAFNTFQQTVGARGPINSTLEWDMSASYGESSRVVTANSGALANVRQALLATNPNTCLTNTGGCVPLNIFGGEGSITPAMLDYLRVIVYNFVDTSLTTAQATISGDLGVSSPFASEAIGVAVGVEYRRYSGFSRGDAISSVQDAVLGAGAPALPQRGEYDSREAFAELIVPLIEDRPFFHSLTLETGVRYSDYSLSGGNWTYKAGGSWEPIEDIKFRGMWSRAVRAPNLAELFQPQVVALTNLTADPCQGQITNAANPNYNARLAAEPALRALCIATGVPAALLGTGAIPAPSSGQIQSTQGGNPNLDPETATTLTLGAVFQPRMVPGLSITLDWYDIKVDAAISAPTAAVVINSCYGLNTNPTLDPSYEFCQLVLRNQTTGRLDGEASTTPGVQLVRTNQGELLTRGWDLGINYRRDLGFARLALAFNGNHTTRSLFRSSPAAFYQECTGFYSTACQPVQPRWSWTLRTTLTWGNGIDTSLLWRHVSSARLEPREGPGGAGVCPGPGEVGSCGQDPTTIFDAYENIPAYDYFDLAIRAPVGDNFTFIFAVTNLLDKDPPFVGNNIGSTAFNGGNTFPSNYDTIGRRFNVGVNVRF